MVNNRTTERALTMGNVRAKVLADDDVPGGPVAFIELLLDLRGDVEKLVRSGPPRPRVPRWT